MDPAVLEETLMQARAGVAQTLLSVLWQDSVESMKNEIEVLRDED